jgi:hypothetical protein
MDIEIIDELIRFQLHGKWSVVENQCYGEVGLRLMNEMWKAVKGRQDCDDGNKPLGLHGGRTDVCRCRGQERSRLPDSR